MKEWQQRKFGELYKVPSRNGLSKPSRVRGSGYKMINMGELFANDRIYDIDMELVPLTDSEKEKAKVESGDLLFARQSLIASGAGKCSIVMKTSELTVFESHLIRVRSVSYTHLDVYKRQGYAQRGDQSIQSAIGRNYFYGKNSVKLCILGRRRLR